MNARPTPEPSGSIELLVADTMKRMRTQQSLTLSALGKQCGLSSAYLSRVENHRAALTLQNLALVAQALKVPVAHFFEEGEASLPLAVCRAGQGKIQKIVRRNAVRLELLAARKRGKLMEPLLISIEPESSPQEHRFHPGEELNFVLEGRCIFSYGQEEIILVEGDSVYYDATVPHAMHAEGGKRCLILAAVASRDYLFHGDLAKLLKVDCR